METTWKILCFWIGFGSIELCNGLPMELLSTNDGPNAQLIGILVAIMVSVCVVLAFVGCVCCQRRRGFKEFRDSPVTVSVVTDPLNVENDPGHVNPIASPEFTIFTPLSPPHHNNNVFRTHQPVISYVENETVGEPSNKRIEARIDGLDVSSWFDGSQNDFPRTKLKYIRELGNGWFGRVVEGEAQNITNTQQNDWTSVAVRILESSASAHEQALFLQEAAMYRIERSHPHVLRLLGRSLEAAPLLLIQEYCLKGDLKKFLLENRSSSAVMSDLPIQFCCQLASALQYLHDNNIAHLDLAARNCQISKDVTIKLGDYGLAVSHYPNDYYQGTPAVPVRWCAPESLNYTSTTLQPKQVTCESNIWSLGITMWEICEWGAQPYDSLTDDEVVSQVLGAPYLRLLQPGLSVSYIQPLYRLMQLCWQSKENRPQINQIYSMLLHILQTYHDQTSSKSPSKSDAFSPEDFDTRWETFKPNTIVKTDNHISSETEMTTSTSSVGELFPNESAQKKSESLTNLHGSFDNLTDIEGEVGTTQMDSWLQNVASDTGDMQYVRGLSQAIQALDSALESEQTSSAGSSDRKLDFRLGPKSESSSETEDETWKNRIERGAYSEKVRQKSKSVADLMILTHIECSDTDSETPLQSLDYRVNYKNVRWTPKANLEGTSMIFGSEGNLLTVHDTFQEELRKLQEERKDSLLFVPAPKCISDNCDSLSNDKQFDLTNGKLQNEMSNTTNKHLIVGDKSNDITSCFLHSVDNSVYCDNLEQKQVMLEFLQSERQFAVSSGSIQDMLIEDLKPLSCGSSTVSRPLFDLIDKEDLEESDITKSKNLSVNIQLSQEFITNDNSDLVINSQSITPKLVINCRETNSALQNEFNTELQQNQSDALVINNIINVNTEGADANKNALVLKLTDEISIVQNFSNSNNLVRDQNLSQLSEINTNDLLSKEEFRSNKSTETTIDDEQKQLDTALRLEKINVNQAIDVINVTVAEHPKECEQTHPTTLKNVISNESCATLEKVSQRENLYEQKSSEKILTENIESKLTSNQPDVLLKNDKELTSMSTEIQNSSELNTQLKDTTSVLNVNVELPLSKNFDLTTSTLSEAIQKDKTDKTCLDVKLSTEERDLTRNVTNEDLKGEFENKINIPENIRNSADIDTTLKSPQNVSNETELISVIDNIKGSIEQEFDLNLTEESKINLHESDIEFSSQIPEISAESINVSENTNEIISVNKNTNESEKCLLTSDTYSVENRLMKVDESVTKDVISTTESNKIDDKLETLENKPINNEFELNQISSDCLLEQCREDLLLEKKLMNVEKNINTIIDLDTIADKLGSTSETDFSVENLLSDIKDKKAKKLNAIVDSNSKVVESENYLKTSENFSNENTEIKELEKNVSSDNNLIEIEAKTTTILEIDNNVNLSDKLESSTVNKELLKDFLLNEIAASSLIEFSNNASNSKKTELLNVTECKSKECEQLGNKILCESESELLTTDNYNQPEAKTAAISVLDTIIDNLHQIKDEFDYQINTTQTKEQPHDNKSPLLLSESKLIDGINIESKNGDATTDNSNVDNIETLDNKLEKSNVKSENEPSSQDESSLQVETTTGDKCLAFDVLNKFQGEVKFSGKKDSYAWIQEFINNERNVIKDEVVSARTVESEPTNLQQVFKVFNVIVDHKTPATLYTKSELLKLIETKSPEKLKSSLASVCTSSLPSEQLLNVLIKPPLLNGFNSDFSELIQPVNDSDTKNVQKKLVDNLDYNSNSECNSPKTASDIFSYVAEGDEAREFQTVILGPCEDYSLDLYTGLKTTFGKYVEDDRPEEELLQFSSNFMPLEPTGVDHSLETWDRFLGKSLQDHENSSSSEFEHFDHELSETNKLSDLNSTFVLDGKTETDLPENLNETYVVGNTSKEANVSEEVISSSWEPGEGWFLHPQMPPEELTGQIEISENNDVNNSYVGFTLDEECMNALRSELEAKLPYAQGKAREEPQELNDWDSEERNEVIVKYNVYGTLSPIPEESCCDDLLCDQTHHRNVSDSESDWSESCGGASRDEDVLVIDTETHTAQIFESPSSREPQQHHTPSQDSCCSNDTLFNLEDLNYGLTEHEPAGQHHDDDLLQVEVSEPETLQEQDESETVLNLTYTKDDKSLEAPLPSPEETPWRQLPASLLTYENIAQNVVIHQKPSDDVKDAEDSESSWQQPPTSFFIRKDIAENFVEQNAGTETKDIEELNLIQEEPKLEEDLSDTIQDHMLDTDLTDIRFTGPGDAQLMSTSFSESADIAEERDWDSGSDTRSSSSGEFIWKEGEHEESLRALHAASHDMGVTEELNRMDAIEEENSDSSDDGEEDIEEAEFVPSAWDAQATPTKSSIKSTEKSKKQKGVWFKKQKYHSVYEYPREPESPVASSSDLWMPLSDFSTFADWQPTDGNYDLCKMHSNYPLVSGNARHRDLYQMNPFSTYNPGVEEDFFISSSARPFQTLNQGSQFFPGQSTAKAKSYWQDNHPNRDFSSDNITPDSGVEDITPANAPDTFLNLPPSPHPRQVQSLKFLATVAANKSKAHDSLGGLRHTRNRLKLDLPPSPNSFSVGRTFAMDVANEPLQREQPTFTTFGKSRFSVQHVQTPTDEAETFSFGKMRSKNVSFEALPHKRDFDEDRKVKTVEVVQGEASLLDSADEDSGIESSANATLERHPPVFN